MVWIYFQESEAAPLPLPDTSGSLPIAKLSEPPKQCSSPEWPQATSPQPRSGMMFQRCEAATYPTESTSLQAGSPAKILALQAMGQAWQESEAAFFMKSQGCVASLSHDSSFWKTSQPSLLEVEPKWLEPLPRWGMIVDGAFYPLRPLERLAGVSGGSYWQNTIPSPLATDYKGGSLTRQDDHRHQYKHWFFAMFNKITGDYVPCPMFTEWVLGYPLGWTEYEGWAMRGCQRKPAKRLKC